MPLISSGAPEQYSQWVGSVYIFNLIVGTGALTIPYAFRLAGWLMGTVVVMALAFISYITVTFVIESMAASNAILQWRKCQRNHKVEYELPNSASIAALDDTDHLTDEDDIEALSNDETESYEDAPLLENNGEVTDSLPSPKDFYNIQEKVEMGQMVSLLFNKVGVILFYTCICIYLFGDLAIYCAAVSKSLRDVTCTNIPVNYSCNKTINNNERCWSTIALSRTATYRIYVVVFLFLLGPFVFFNVQKTKYLQILTSLLRWIAFTTMIILAIIHLAKGRGEGTPSIANIKGVPHLFGVCVYSFMCHHSLPALVTPIRNKQKLFTLFAIDYFAILCFYLLLAFTGVFSFDRLYDLYTLNFQPDLCNPNNPDSIVSVPFVRYFLALFPVFTLSTNFPIIGITLRNNLQALFLKDQFSNVLVKRLVFPLLAILPPVAIALITENIEFLVNFTGSYAGAGIQYIIPAFLIYKSRQMTLKCIGPDVKNSHPSPFRHKSWIWFVGLWAVSCIILVTINNILNLD